MSVEHPTVSMPECYICLEDDNGDSGPLMDTPCECHSLVHQRCLTQWCDYVNHPVCTVCNGWLDAGVLPPVVAKATHSTSATTPPPPPRRSSWWWWCGRRLRLPLSRCRQSPKTIVV